MSSVIPWKGRFDDPEIKKINFINGTQTVADGRDYFGELENEIKEKNRSERSSPNTTSSQSPRVLVRVLEARDLLSTNSNGSSEAFATISLGDSKFNTKVEKNTLDPIWEFEKEFEINTNIFNELEISVWDSSNTHQEAFLGVVYIDLGKMDARNKLTDTQPHWLELQPRKWNEHVGGEICVQLIRTGKKIPRVVPQRVRKQDIFDLELKTSEAEQLLEPMEYCKYSKIMVMHKTGMELFQSIKSQIADLDDGLYRPRKKITRTTTKWTPINKKSKTKINTNRRSEKTNGIYSMLAKLPEEVLFRIFLFLNAVERAHVSRVCWDWNRIMQDPGLRSPLMEIIEVIEKEKSETDLNIKKTLSLQACQKLKPVITCLIQLSQWQTETSNLLNPFPIEDKDKFTILQTLALIRSLTQLTHLAWSLDKWKVNLQHAYRAFKDTFHFFEINYHLLPDHDNKEKPFHTNFSNDCISFLDNNSLESVFTDLSGHTSGTSLSQIVLLSQVMMSQIQKQRFITKNELESLLVYLAVSLLWIITSGHIEATKKSYKFKPQKIIKILKEHEEYIPYWVLEAITCSPNTKNNKKLFSLVKEFA